MADPPSYEEALRVDTDVDTKRTFSLRPLVVVRGPFASFESLVYCCETMAEPDNNSPSGSRFSWNIRQGRRFMSSASSATAPNCFNNKNNPSKKAKKRTCGCFDLLIVNVFGP